MPLPETLIFHGVYRWGLLSGFPTSQLPTVHPPYLCLVNLWKTLPLVISLIRGSTLSLNTVQISDLTIRPPLAILLLGKICVQPLWPAQGRGQGSTVAEATFTKRPLHATHPPEGALSAQNQVWLPHGPTPGELRQLLFKWWARGAGRVFSYLDMILKLQKICKCSIKKSHYLYSDSLIFYILLHLFHYVHYSVIILDHLKANQRHCASLHLTISKKRDVLLYKHCIIINFSTNFTLLEYYFLNYSLTFFHQLSQ